MRLQRKLSPGVRKGFRALEGKIDRALADGSRLVGNAWDDSEHMPGQERDGVVVKVNEETTFQREEGLVGVGMTMPGVRFRHRADTDFVVVDFGDRMVIAPLRRC